MRKRDIRVIYGAAIWTLYVWITRMWNIWRDTEHDMAFKTVHTVLAVISIGFAVALLQIARRYSRRAPMNA